MCLELRHALLVSGDLYSNHAHSIFYNISIVLFERWGVLCIRTSGKIPRIWYCSYELVGRILYYTDVHHFICLCHETKIDVFLIEFAWRKRPVPVFTNKQIPYMYWKVSLLKLYTIKKSKFYTDLVSDFSHTKLVFRSLWLLKNPKISWCTPLKNQILIPNIFKR